MPTLRKRWKASCAAWADGRPPSRAARPAYRASMPPPLEASRRLQDARNRAHAPPIRESTQTNWPTVATTIVAIVGVVLVAAGQLFTNAADRNQQDLAQRGQIADRYTKAIEQLGQQNKPGDSKLSIRLGAVFALQQLMVDAPDYETPVAQVLNAFVRSHAELPAKIPRPVPDSPADVRAAVKVLADRQDVGKPWRIDLSGTLLGMSGVDFSQSDLNGVNFRSVNLRFANLTGADLGGADLTDADLTGANLTEADLTGADLIGADLSLAALYHADLSFVDWSGANLKGACSDEQGLSDLADALRITDDQLADVGLCVTTGIPGQPR